MKPGYQSIDKPDSGFDTMQHQDLDVVKDRGAFYTPKSIANFLVDWGMDLDLEKIEILEQACGDGIFISSILDLVGAAGIQVNMTAIEINPQEAESAGKQLNQSNSDMISGEVYRGEYFSFMNKRNFRRKQFNLVLGNPPYIKQPKFRAGREEAIQRMADLNLRINQQSNAWVYFVIDAISRLSNKGRIGLVIPADLLQLDYAKVVQSWITEHLSNILIVGFDELVFPKIQQDVVLLMGEKNDDQDGKRLRFTSIKNESELSSELWRDLMNTETSNPLTSNPWDSSFLSEEPIRQIKSLHKKPEVKTFEQIADLRIGIVTGANDFFCINRSKLKQLGLRRGRNKGIVVKKVMTAGMKIRSLKYTHRDHERFHNLNAKANLLVFDSKTHRTDLRKKIDEYLENGETSGYHLRNQLARRNPWYLSEHVIATELGMFKRSHIHPILFHKPADIYSTDTIFRVWIKPEMEAHVSPKQLAFSFINSLTFLSSEMVGRSYGGGVLELTPKEIRSIKIPPFKCSDKEFQTLNAMFKDGKGIEEILDYTDSIILHFLTADEKKLLRTLWKKLNIRRRNRSKRRRK